MRRNQIDFTINDSNYNNVISVRKVTKVFLTNDKMISKATLDANQNYRTKFLGTGRCEISKREVMWYNVQ